MSSAFAIDGLGGKRTLSGTIAVCGAKNAALKMLAASLLFTDPVELQNVPDIEDIRRMKDLLTSAGGEVIEGKSGTLTIHYPGEVSTHLDEHISKRLRASIVLTGPMLSRFGQVTFPHPGGCVIGARPIDLFIDGFTRMGATVRETGKDYVITAPKGGLKGAEIFFRNQSVTGTENFLLAGVLARGKTVLQNAALEPEIVALAEYLISCGAHITGAGTPTIVIQGGELLRANGRAGVIPPDRIEAGSFLVMGALAAKELTITDCDPSHLTAPIELLRSAGVSISTSENSITISEPKSSQEFRAVSLKTHEYPGFPTDLQAPMVIFLTQSVGESLVFETIFEGRLSYTEQLVRMGANITAMDPHRVLVKGPSVLHGKNLESPDLRAGLAFVIAATIAEGPSLIHNVYNIDRGYERIEERLQAIGVPVKRVEV